MKALATPIQARRQPGQLLDPRFRALLGRENWARLPAAVRRRFSRATAGDEATVYRGQVIETTLNRCGKALAHLGRLIGGPLPLEEEAGGPTVVTVTKNLRGDRQYWTRQYPRRRGLPQVIQSSKRFAGPTGLEEHVGCGVGMTLALRALPDRLIFRSVNFFIEAWGRRLQLPRWLLPLHIEVTHLNLDDRHFMFGLSVTSRWLGTLIAQRAVYEDATS